MDGEEKNIRFDVCVAMCHSNRGIGLNGYFPWPYLKGDHDHYKKLTMTRRNQRKSIAFILGRRTWEYWYEEERQTPGLHNIIISSRLQDGHHPTIHKVCSTFDDAMEYLMTVREQIEHIWIMGGAKNYEIALKHHGCHRIYLTRIFGDFPADVFFPKFEDNFQKINCGDIENTIYEDNGIQYCFEVYEKL